MPATHEAFAQAEMRKRAHPLSVFPEPGIAHDPPMNIEEGAVDSENMDRLELPTCVLLPARIGFLSCHIGGQQDQPGMIDLEFARPFLHWPQVILVAANFAGLKTFTRQV